MVIFIRLHGALMCHNQTFPSHFGILVLLDILMVKYLFVVLNDIFFYKAPQPRLPAATSVATATSSQPMEGVSVASTVPPAQRWATQLRQLGEMGITDTEVALQALEATKGNLELAFSILFS